MLSKEGWKNRHGEKWLLIEMTSLAWEQMALRVYSLSNRFVWTMGSLALAVFTTARYFGVSAKCVFTKTRFFFGKRSFHNKPEVMSGSNHLKNITSKGLLRKHCAILCFYCKIRIFILLEILQFSWWWLAKFSKWSIQRLWSSLTIT